VKTNIDTSKDCRIEILLAFVRGQKENAPKKFYLPEKGCGN
jgi:hypothetical protein